MPAVTDDHALAARLAGQTGETLLELRASIGFAEPGELRDAGDAAAHRLLMRELAAHRPADAVLSEHGGSDPDVLAGTSRCWIVDPLDGTREFGEPGRQDWAVHVALASDDELVAGAVALPPQGAVLHTADPPRPRPRQGRMRIVASRSRRPAFLSTLSTTLDAELVPLGSAGAKTAAVLQGEVDAYIHAGGQYVWDSAAPVAVARAGGFHASRLDGSPLTYRDTDPWLPDLLVCHPDLAEQLLAELATVLPG